MLISGTYQMLGRRMNIPPNKIKGEENEKRIEDDTCQDEDTSTDTCRTEMTCVTKLPEAKNSYERTTRGRGSFPESGIINPRHPVTLP
jgi:hypothetical protein